MHVEATSDAGSRKTHIVETTQGSCDTKNVNENHDQKVDVPLEAILGPFKGTPLDKNLKDNQKKTEKSDQPEEETVTQIEFDLSRK